GPTDFEKTMLTHPSLKTVHRFLVSITASRKLKSLVSASDFSSLILPDLNTMMEKAYVEPYVLTNKIEWLGQKNQLSELFIELYKKGFISNIEAPTIKVIKAAFTETDSLSQLMKPTQDSDSKEKTYSL